jgi:hypothetical protein
MPKLGRHRHYSAHMHEWLTYSMYQTRMHTTCIYPQNTSVHTYKYICSTRVSLIDIHETRFIEDKIICRAHHTFPYMCGIINPAIGQDLDS